MGILDYFDNAFRSKKDKKVFKNAFRSAERGKAIRKAENAISFFQKRVEGEDSRERRDMHVARIKENKEKLKHLREKKKGNTSPGEDSVLSSQFTQHLDDLIVSKNSPAFEYNHGKALNAIARLIQLKVLHPDKEVRKKQLESLGPWIQYLRGAVYSAEFKYFVLRSVLSLTVNWTKRQGKNTRFEFPLYSNDTPQILGIMNTLFSEYSDTFKDDDLDKIFTQAWNENDDYSPELKLAAEKGDFSQMFQLLQQQVELDRQLSSGGEIVEGEGEWNEKFSFYSNGNEINEGERKKVARKLAELCKYGNDFCIKGVGTAQEYLEKGDIYVYTVKSKFPNGLILPIPVIAVHIIRRMIDGNAVQVINPEEIHGNGPGQSIMKEYLPIARKWIAESSFANKDEFEIKFADAELLEAIREKIEKLPHGPDLTGRELRFLYEIYRPVTSFKVGQINGSSDIDELFSQRVSILASRNMDYKAALAELKRIDYRKMFGQNVSEVIAGGNKSDRWLGADAHENLVISKIKNFQKGRKIVVGYVNLMYSTIKDFGNLEEITGSLYLSSNNQIDQQYMKRNMLHSLGKLARVGGIDLTEEDKRKILSGEIDQFPQPNDPRLKKIFY